MAPNFVPWVQYWDLLPGTLYQGPDVAWLCLLSCAILYGVLLLVALFLFVKATVTGKISGFFAALTWFGMVATLVTAPMTFTGFLPWPTPDAGSLTLYTYPHPAAAVVFALLVFGFPLHSVGSSSGGGSGSAGGSRGGSW